ncbi:MAG TPA: hypothetical protein VGX03_22150 [Candidatus Binatia bacterium]|jgi:hypothetical protein|nr:hypothetical protein [Candidatus Binatia bacterium]
MGKYLDIARKLETRRAQEQTSVPASEQSPSPLDCRQLYRQAAETVHDDCWSIDPAWLCNHPEHYERIKALDDRLTVMEHAGASEVEYRATLARLMECIQDARAACEREREQSGEPVARQ